MRIHSIALILAAAGMTTSIGLAQNSRTDDGFTPAPPFRAQRGGPEGERFGGPGGPDQMHRRAMLKQFDANGDGTLDQTEREAARAHFEEMRAQHHQRMLDQFDTNGDGQFDEAERETMRTQMRAQMEQFRQDMLDRFDADGDGTLSREEHQAIRAAIEAGEIDPPPFPRPHMRHGRHGLHGNGDRLGRFGEDDGFGRRGDFGPRGRFGEDDGFGPRRGPGRHGGMHGPGLSREQLDLNGDGTIDASEREAAREKLSAMRDEMRQRRDELKDQFDANHDGTLSEDERNALREFVGQQRAERRAQRRADANGDGTIDAAELADALEKVKAGDASADFNGDGEVNSADAQFIADQFINRGTTN